MPAEVEIKFRVHDVKALEAKLRDAGFWIQTPSKHEVNTLYDLPNGDLRKKGEVLRIRRYGDKWKLTHKTKGDGGKHKSRMESETAVTDGEQMNAILTGLGYAPAFVYEKYRAEYADGRGDVVIDRTPIGDLAEIEGPPDWIDEIAKKLGVDEKDYDTRSYVLLFQDWKEKTKWNARNMTFEECGTTPPSGN